MPFVLLSGLTGTCIALFGLTIFGMAWTTALAVWLLSGPVGVLMALLVYLTPSLKGAKAPAGTSSQQQAA